MTSDHLLLHNIKIRGLSIEIQTLEGKDLLHYSGCHIASFPGSSPLPQEVDKNWVC